MTLTAEDLDRIEAAIRRVGNAGPFEARVVPDAMPAACCPYGLVSHRTGMEVARVWEEDEVRLMALLLNAAPSLVAIARKSLAQ